MVSHSVAEGVDVHDRDVTGRSDGTKAISFGLRATRERRGRVSPRRDEHVLNERGDCETIEELQL